MADNTNTNINTSTSMDIANLIDIVNSLCKKIVI